MTIAVTFRLLWIFDNRYSGRRLTVTASIAHQIVNLGNVVYSKVSVDL